MTGGRRWLAVTAAVATGGVLLVGPPAAADQTYWVPVTDRLVVHGRGFGHGHGMSQYGAQAAARRGKTYEQILGFYYPGTGWGRARGRLRVLITADTSSDVRVAPRRGLSVRSLKAHTTFRLPDRTRIKQWRIKPKPGGASAVQFRARRSWHRWRVFRGDSEFFAPGPIKLWVPGGASETGHRYRGRLRSASPYDGAANRDTVNVVRVDDYVRGVLPYEMPSSWAPPALRAQAVAARTYAAWQRAQNRNRYFQICDTAACQVYGGVRAERRSTNRAVRATSRRILLYQGKSAFTQFSASSGGWTAAGGVPYLRAKKDRYDDWKGNPYHRWKRRIDVSRLEAAYPRLGGLLSVRVTQRNGVGKWGGRVEQVVLVGKSGKVWMSGDDFRWTFGLRSTWFSIAPTPIIRRWKKLGGASSRLGRITTAEFTVSDGAARCFEGGRIYWSKSTGAKELWGPVLRRYRQFGGPGSQLGFPETGILRAVGDGRKASLEHGRIFYKRAPGAHVLYGPILRKFEDVGQVTSRLGYPKTNIFDIRGGRRAKFQHGNITWDRSTHQTTVHYRN